MEYHVDRQVVLNQEPKFKNLYSWSLQEVGSDDKQIGSDQVPWPWTLYFTAIELVLSDTIEIEVEHPSDTKDEKTAVQEKRFIRGKLRPGIPRAWGRFGDRLTRYSMFGTNRAISEFELFIEKLQDEQDKESCETWGSVRYTSDIDFRDETTDDAIIFYLRVRPETFARYAEKIARSEVDEAVLRVGRVAGFYSDWSPSISTSDIKVLTRDTKHPNVQIPDDCQIDPPRLGKVGEAELYLRRIAKLARQETAMEDDTLDDESPSEERPGVGSEGEPAQALAIADTRVVKLLSSLRTVAWIIAGLLLAILIRAR